MVYHGKPQGPGSKSIPANSNNIPQGIPPGADIPPPGEFFEGFNDGLGDFGEVGFDTGSESGLILVEQ